jgi:hypothetical protein
MNTGHLHIPKHASAFASRLGLQVQLRVHTARTRRVGEGACLSEFMVQSCKLPEGLVCDRAARPSGGAARRTVHEMVVLRSLQGHKRSSCKTPHFLGAGPKASPCSPQRLINTTTRVLSLAGAINFFLSVGVIIDAREVPLCWVTVFRNLIQIHDTRGMCKPTNRGTAAYSTQDRPSCGGMCRWMRHVLMKTCVALHHLVIETKGRRRHHEDLICGLADALLSCTRTIQCTGRRLGHIMHVGGSNALPAEKPAYGPQVVSTRQP